jgi:glycosyltransferase involved in cell wall biosynthesis
MEPLKILRVITRMNVGGPALHVQVLSEGLARRGYQTVLAAGTCLAEEGDLPAELPPGTKIVTIERLARSISPLRDLAAAWKLYRLMRRERPAIVHTHTAKAGLVGRLAARAAGVPIVVHTFHGNSLSGYFSPRASAVLRRIEKVLALFTDRICVVSAQQEREIADRYRIAPRAKLRVVPLGLDLREDLRQPVSEPHDRVLRVGWLGRMVGIKGVPLLAGIIAEAVRRNLPVQFLVAGDGPERGWLQDAAKRYGPDRLRWNGWQQDVGAFIASCDLLIQTSANEGTPVALIQGMAAGRPFVSTPAGGVVDLVCPPELSNRGGCRWFANGVLAPPSPASFANALECLIRDPALIPRMGLAARRFAAERFQAERLVDDMDRLYRELIERRLPVTAGYSALQRLTGEPG